MYHDVNGLKEGFYKLSKIRDYMLPHQGQCRALLQQKNGEQSTLDLDKADPRAH